MVYSDKVMVKLNCTGMNTNVELGECRVHTQTNPLTQLTNEIHEQRQTYIRSHAMDLGGFTCKVLMTKKECADILVLSVMLTVTFIDQTFSVAYFHHGSYQALPDMEGESLVHFFMCVTSRVDMRQTQFTSVWARTIVCPHSLELVSKVSTRVATKAPKALNRKVDRCSMFSCSVEHGSFLEGLYDKKNCDLLSVVSQRHYSCT